MMPVQNNAQRNLVNLQPLTQQTRKTLSACIFGGHALQGGCEAYQSLATRAVPLRDLQQKLQDGSLDLGCKDKAWAIAACIGSAVLVAAIAALAFWMCVSFPGILIQAAADPTGITIAALFTMVALGAIPLMLAIEHAKEVFGRPSPQQLEEQLTQISENAVEGQEQVQAVIDRLTAQIEGYNEPIQEADAIGNNSKQRALTNDRDRLQQALEDLQRLKQAVETLEVRQD